LECEPA